jgi:hypothetical protein
MTHDIAHGRSMKVEMLGDFSLPVSMPFNRFDDVLVSLSRVVQDTLREDYIQRWSVGIPLAFGNLGNMVTLAEVVRVAANKFDISQEDLAFDLCPDGFLVDPPGDELAVFS